MAHFGVPVVGLTATASPREILDIRHLLEIPNWKILRGDLNRENIRLNSIYITFYLIFYYFFLFLNFFFEKNKRYEIIPVSGTVAGVVGQFNQEIQNIQGQVIIYAPTKPLVELIARLTSARFYHSTVPPEEKKEIIRQFNEGTLHTVVATSAFGLGIDNPNVEKVFILITVIGGMSSFIQQSGRCGRSGQQATATFYFHQNMHNGLSKSSYFPQDQLNQISDFASRRKCRRYSILEHLGSPPKTCSQLDSILCDICDGTFEQNSAKINQVDESIISFFK